MRRPRRSNLRSILRRRIRTMIRAGVSSIGSACHHGSPQCNANTLAHTNTHTHTQCAPADPLLPSWGSAPSLQPLSGHSGIGQTRDARLFVAVTSHSSSSTLQLFLPNHNGVRHGPLHESKLLFVPGRAEAGSDICGSPCRQACTGGSEAELRRLHTSLHAPPLFLLLLLLLLLLIIIIIIIPSSKSLSLLL